MAIFSTQYMYSDAQAVTADSASTNVIDHGASGTWVHASTPIVDDKGASCLPLAIQVNETFNNLTSLTVRFEADDDEAFGSATVLYQETIPAADLVAGKKTAVRMIPFSTTERYTRIFYDVTGPSPTTGQMTAGVACLENPWGNR